MVFHVFCFLGAWFDKLQLWRKSYDDQRPESFSDAETWAARSKRFVTAISFTLIMFLLTFLTLLICFLLKMDTLNASHTFQFVLGLILSGGFSAGLLAIMRAIWKKRNP